MEERIVVLVTEDKKREIRVAAANEGKSMGEYLRDLHDEHETRKRAAA